MTRCLPLLCLLVACGRTPGGDPLRLVPADTGRALIAPSLATLQAKTVDFLAGIEGSSGVLDLVADRFGLDLRTPEGPEALGLDTQKGIAVWGRDAGTWVAAASVGERERFLAGVRQRLERGAGARLTAGQPDEAPEGGAWLFAAPDASWHAALGVSADNIGVVVLTSDGQDALSQWNQVVAGSGAGFVGSARAAGAQAALAPESGSAVAWLVASELLPDAPRELGLARGLVQGMRDGLPLFVGGAAMPGEGRVDSLVLKVAAEHSGEGFLPVSWVRPPGSPEALAKAFPKTTTAFLRMRFELDKVRSLPGFIRDSVLPERLPGLEALPLPTVSDLVDMVEGDFALAVLGLDADANLGQISSLRALGQRALSLLHVAIAARVRDAAALTRAFASIAAQLGTSGWTVAAITPTTPNGYQGWSFAREGAHYAVLIDGALVIFLVGAGEVDGFMAVKEGRALSLASFAEHGSLTVKQALGQPDAAAPGGAGATPFGFALSPLRLSRELAARGLPPYFLKIINDVRLVTGTVSAEEKRLGLALEIAL